MNPLELAVFGLLGALCAFSANQGYAVFHDGIRPLLETTPRSALHSQAWRLSALWIFAYALPYTLMSGVVTAHLLLLSTDLIGIRFPKNKFGAAGAFIFGAGAALGMLLLFSRFPLPSLSLLFQNTATPLLYAAPIAPFLALALSHGLLAAALSFVLSLILALKAPHPGLIFEEALLLCGLAALFLIPIKNKNLSSILPGPFLQNQPRLRARLPLYACMGGLISAAVSLRFMAEGPVQSILFHYGLNRLSALFALFSVFAYLPQIPLSALASGVYSPAGLKFVFVTGALFQNPLIAFAAGAFCIIAEITFLPPLARTASYFSALKAREASAQAAEFTLAAGALIASSAYAPLWGPVTAAAVLLLHKTAQSPLPAAAMWAAALVWALKPLLGV